MRHDTGQAPIADHGVVGDLHTVALVTTQGTIDFCSFPRFDSPTIFASLLDHDRGGHFSIHPTLEDVTYKQMYLPDTNILITRFLSPEGLSEVSDFMPIGVFPHDHPRVLVRRVKCVRGVVRFDLEFDPRFDYARAERTIDQRGDGEVIYASKGADGTAVRLRSPWPLTIDGDGVGRASFELGAGQKAAFVMEEVGDHLLSPSANPDYVSAVFKETVNFWRNWIGKSRYHGRWRETVNRSALVLKLLVSQTHGSLVAAPTFGLPELVGGERNWDYRYTWIRDASFTLLRADPPRLHRGGRRVHALDPRPVHGPAPRRVPPDHVRPRRTQGPHRGDASEPRRLPGLDAGPDRQRRVRPAPARHLRRADGRRVPVQQVRAGHPVRAVGQPGPPRRLGLRPLAASRRGRLGGPRRRAGVLVLAPHVLGRGRPRHPPRRPSLVPATRSTGGGRRATRSTTRS